MQNIVKTLISGFKILVNKKIRGSVADWNQNDSSADNYVKNRTHWVEEGTVAYVENLTSEMYHNGEAPKCTFVAGNTYDILWNGTWYKGLVCYESEGWRIVADESLGCPFYIDDDGGNALYIESDDDWTVSIYEYGTVIHKLDEKYLPDSVAKADDVAELQSIVSRDEDGNVSIYGDGIYIDNSDSSEKIATEKYFYDPKRYLVVTDEADGYTYLVTTKNGNLVSYIQTQSIAVTKMPNKTTYVDGEKFNPDGMVVTATGVDGSAREITNYTYDVVTSSNLNSFAISYTELGITYIARISLTLHDFSLIDFDYIVNEDGTYTLTAWKGTYNGEPSTRIIVPDSELIIV